MLSGLYDSAGLYTAVEQNGVAGILARQLVRSDTSIGANVQEAQGAQSRPDFISKLSIAYKEARESAYWLRIIHESQLVPSDRLADLRDETNQIMKILSSILVSTKRGKRPETSTLNS